MQTVRTDPRFEKKMDKKKQRHCVWVRFNLTISAKLTRFDADSENAEA